VAFEEDLALFFDESEFAVAAARTPAAGGAAQPGTVIFDSPGVLLEDAGVVTAEPSLLVPASQWAGFAVGDTITLEAADLPSQLQQLAGSYKVRQILPTDDSAVLRSMLART
jgi:hypothetical protein